MFTKKHYEVVEAVIAAQPQLIERNRLTESFVAVFANDNPQFKPSRFRKEVENLVWDREAQETLEEEAAFDREFGPSDVP